VTEAKSPAPKADAPPQPEPGGSVDPQAAVTWYAPNKQCVGVSIAATVSTGATAGAPGTWTPPGSEPPYDVSGMGGVTASPATAWTTGQHVVTSSGARVNWSGTKWASGVHAVLEEAPA
jgi:hypothetical protein